jgi:hypothetical protein
MHAELRDEGYAVNHKRVGRLMRLGGLRGASRRRKWRTTTRDKEARPAPDLVERNFNAAGPDQLWVADITYIPTEAGFLFLAVVLDAWSRRVVGWAMATHLKTDCRFQPRSMSGRMPSSRATWEIAFPPSVTRRTASTLNSDEKRSERVLAAQLPPLPLAHRHLFLPASYPTGISWCPPCRGKSSMNPSAPP